MAGLREAEFGAGILLNPHKRHIRIRAARIGMNFRVARTGDAIFGVLFVHIVNQLAGIMEASAGLYVRLTGRGIDAVVAAEGEDVLKAVGRVLVQVAVNGLFVFHDAGIVGHAVDALLLDIRADFHALALVGTTGAIGAANEIGIVLFANVDFFLQLRNAIILFWGEDLK